MSVDTSVDTTESKPVYRTITLTGRGPVRIREDKWPLIASGRSVWYEGEVRAQANRVWSATVCVREHEDGRLLIYGRAEYDTRWQHEQCESRRAGLYDSVPHRSAGLVSGEELARMIGDVADILVGLVSSERSDLVQYIRDAEQECVANLPAQDID